jgi:hypothetical protein
MLSEHCIIGWRCLPCGKYSKSDGFFVIELIIAAGWNRVDNGFKLGPD